VLLLDAHAAAPKGESMSTLIDWPAKQAAPLRCAFMVREAAPPPSLAALLEAEKVARTREETNALYVAMTRALQRLVVSGMQPFRENEASWWMRVAPHAQAVQIDQVFSVEQALGEDVPNTIAPAAKTFTFIKIKENSDNVIVMRSYAAIKSKAIENTELSRIGQAMHKLLEWRDASRVQEVAAMYALNATQADSTQSMAHAMLCGEAAWVWDDAQLTWQGDEVPMQVDGKNLRLDRLVQRADTGHWWVLDYKSAAHPERQADLRAQLAAYAQAVQSAYPAATVHAAFISSQGALVIA
jgi:ATP-dependent helicase/nuclease subunit A